MQITRAAEYAIRGVLYLCMQPKGSVCLLSDISEKQDIPPSFLSKIFQNLARAGFVSSFRGTGGGFTLLKDPEEITLLDKFGKLRTLEVHIADQPKTRAAGYQHICEKLIHDTAILFVYARENRGQFHMNNVQAPLDIGFFDGEGRLQKVLLMKPYTASDRPIYDPGVPFQYALEARQGYFADSALAEGKARLVIRSVSDQN